MQTRLLFHLWPRLHQDVLGFLGLVPPGGLDASLPGGDLGGHFRHIAAVEDYWRRVILEPEAEYREIDRADCPDVDHLRTHLEGVFAATERLLEASLVEALLARPVRSRFPVRNGLEALTLCHLHTVHHRAQLSLGLRSQGVDPGDWI